MLSTDISCASDIEIEDIDMEWRTLGTKDYQIIIYH